MPAIILLPATRFTDTRTSAPGERERAARRQQPGTLSAGHRREAGFMAPRLGLACMDDYRQFLYLLHLGRLGVLLRSL